MAKVYHQIISLTNKPPSLRTDDELEHLVPWLRKKSSHLFQDLEDHKIKKLLKEADFRRYRFDDVIIRQGDIGEEFYILISGSISFHVNSTDDVETAVQKQKQEEAAAREQGRSVNREVYGPQVGTGAEGRTFGELALIYSDCVRNATVISSKIYSDVLVVSKDLYNETLSGSQSREFEAKEEFVRESPLFHNWSIKYRRMVAMSIEKVKLKFEDVIVKQGAPVNGLHFLISGQVKIRVDPSLHRLQFPQHFPMGDIADLEKQKARELLRKEMNLQRHRAAGKKSTYERRSNMADSRKPSHKPLELCLMGAVDTIGDLEMVLGLPCYSQSVECTEAATVYHLDQRNYDRLVEKKHPQTADLMRDIVHTKLTLHFSRLPDDSIPMYRYALYTLDEREREARAKQQQQRQQQASRGRHPSTTANTTNTTETHFEIDKLQKGPLVNLYGPGSVFYLIRTKAKERQQKRQRALKAATGTTNRFGPGKHQTSPYGRAPLADNSRFLYADDTSSISDGHIVNLYGYNEHSPPGLAGGEGEGDQGDLVDLEYGEGDVPLEEFEDEEEEEEQEDWATSDVALSNLEERLMRWHSSFLPAPDHAAAREKRGAAALNHSGTAAPAPSHAKGDHCVVKLHRFHFDDDKRPRPGNKVYIRGRDRHKMSVTPADQTVSEPGPELDRHFAKYLMSPRTPLPFSERPEEVDEIPNAVSFWEESRKPLLQKRASSAGVIRSPGFSKPFKKPKSRHQYTAEEYMCLKEELRRRQQAYKSFLPHRSNTVLF